MIRSILHPANLPVLERAVAGPLLLGLDFDGTLAPIVRRPALAALSPSTATLLRRLTALYPTAILSGRSVRDLTSRLGGLQLAGLAGNHGRERAGFMAPGREAVDGWHGALAGALAGIAGVEIEHKGCSLTIHWRRARALARVRRSIGEAVAGLRPPPRVIGGKAVTNIVPDDGIDKGTALLDLMRQTGCATALYVGDDETDEDVFRLPPAARVIGIRVGRSAESRAGYRLDGQHQIDALLHLLVALRTPGSPASARIGAPPDATCQLLA